jgi:hypothetical protein
MEAYNYQQCFGSGSGLDPVSIRIRIRYQEGKDDPQKQKKLRNLMFCNAEGRRILLKFGRHLWRPAVTNSVSVPDPA